MGLGKFVVGQRYRCTQDWLAAYDEGDEIEVVALGKNRSGKPAVIARRRGRLMHAFTPGSPVGLSMVLIEEEAEWE